MVRPVLMGPLASTSEPRRSPPVPPHDGVRTTGLAALVPWGRSALLRIDARWACKGRGPANLASDASRQPTASAGPCCVRRGPTRSGRRPHRNGDPCSTSPRANPAFASRVHLIGSAGCAVAPHPNRGGRSSLRVEGWRLTEAAALAVRMVPGQDAFAKPERLSSIPAASIARPFGCDGATGRSLPRWGRAISAAPALLAARAT